MEFGVLIILALIVLIEGVHRLFGLRWLTADQTADDAEE